MSPLLPPPDRRHADPQPGAEHATCYVAQLVHFACYFRKSPDLLGPAEIRAYLIYLAQEKCLAASSIIVTISALRFFYTVTLRRPWVIRARHPHRASRGRSFPS